MGSFSMFNVALVDGFQMPMVHCVDMNRISCATHGVDLLQLASMIRHISHGLGMPRQVLLIPPMGIIDYGVPYPIVLSYKSAW